MVNVTAAEMSVIGLRVSRQVGAHAQVQIVNATRDEVYLNIWPEAGRPQKAFIYYRSDGTLLERTPSMLLGMD